MNKLTLKGYLPVGLRENSQVFLGKTHKIFVELDNVKLGDIYNDNDISDPDFLTKLEKEFRNVDKILGMARITIKIEL